ncbi:hypothetical protein [Mycobacterium uberis]|uniref:hypothetical protein n=1 Tax=Mycobacterium uberis TaxID=2162698 RepID=UPI001FB55853|nr:hypothetical protein [Mycobacterium uberis]
MLRIPLQYRGLPTPRERQIFRCRIGDYVATRHHHRGRLQNVTDEANAPAISFKPATQR